MLKKIWDKIVFVWDWLVYSSADANKISLMVKSFLYGILPLVLIITQAFKIQVNSEFLTRLIDGISGAIIVIGGVISAIGFAIGALRKIWYTIKGKNDVIATYYSK